MSYDYVLIVQCDLVQRRCSGFACTNSFYQKADFFKEYDENTKYIAIGCGGCCGKGLSAKLEHFNNKLLKKTDIKRENVAVHLSSCMVTDNYHSDRCPHVDYIKDIIRKRGFTKVVDGTYISQNAAKKRALGNYKKY